MSQLSQQERSVIVNDIVTNCDCWKGKEATLNSLSDDDLTTVQNQVKTLTTNKTDLDKLKSVSDAARKGFEYENVSFTFNEQTQNWEGKKKEPDTNSQSSGATVNTVQTQQTEPPKVDFQAILNQSPELKELVDTMKGIANQQKQATVDDLLSKVKGGAENAELKKTLSGLTNEQLAAVGSILPQETQSAATQQQQRPTFNFFGQGVGSGESKPDFDKDKDILEPSLHTNWAENAKSL